MSPQAKRKSAAQKKDAKAAEPTQSSDPKPENDAERTEDESIPSGLHRPARRPLRASKVDQGAAHEAREAERAAQREAHNARVGGGL